jgi:hypothetical protein
MAVKRHHSSLVKTYTFLTMETEVKKCLVSSRIAHRNNKKVELCAPLRPCNWLFSQITGSPARGSNVWFAVVWPRWPWRLGYISSRCWVHVWTRYFRDVQSLQRRDSRCSGSPTSNGRLQLVSTWHRTILGKVFKFNHRAARLTVNFLSQVPRP